MTNKTQKTKIHSFTKTNNTTRDIKMPASKVATVNRFHTTYMLETPVNSPTPDFSNLRTPANSPVPIFPGIKAPTNSPTFYPSTSREQLDRQQRFLGESFALPGNVHPKETNTGERSYRLGTAGVSGPSAIFSSIISNR